MRLARARKGHREGAVVPGSGTGKRHRCREVALGRRHWEAAPVPGSGTRKWHREEALGRGTGKGHWEGAVVLGSSTGKWYCEAAPMLGSGTGKGQRCREMALGSGTGAGTHCGSLGRGWWVLPPPAPSRPKNTAVSVAAPAWLWHEGLPGAGEDLGLEADASPSVGDPPRHPNTGSAAARP